MNSTNNLFSNNNNINNQNSSTYNLPLNKYNLNLNLNVKLSNQKGDVESWKWAAHKVICDNICDSQLIGRCIRTGQCRCIEHLCRVDKYEKGKEENGLYSYSSNMYSGYSNYSSSIKFKLTLLESCIHTCSIV